MIRVFWGMSIFCIFCVFCGCTNKSIDKGGENKPVEQTEDLEVPVIEEGINVKEIELGMKSREVFPYDKLYNASSISQKERVRLRIDDIDTELLSSKLKNEEIVSGSKIYQSNKGRLETIFVVLRDHMTYEFLVSYDVNGNYIDHIQVGQVPAYYSAELSAKVKGNEIECRMYMGADEGSEEEIEYKKYTITPQLRFVETAQ